MTRKDTHSMDLSNFKGCKPPARQPLIGEYVRLEPIDASAHAALTHALCGPENESLWDYIPIYQPKAEELLQTLIASEQSQGWVTHILIDQKTNAPLGTASLMRLRPEQGSAEIGFVVFGHALQRTAAATEVIYLTASYLFDELGYRRYEWKCNNDNEASKRAALRFGFKFEGVFRNDMVVKGKNRDTAWFAMTDDDWRELKPGYETWLNPENFDADGRQIVGLADALKLT